MNKSHSAAAFTLFAGITVASCGGGDDSASHPEANACTPADSTVCRGKANFHDRTLAGLGSNGQACSDCHMDAENFQLTPAAAQARFARMTMTGVDDPLFRAIDADDFRINGAAARDFTNPTQLSLVRIPLPLPANVRRSRVSLRRSSTGRSPTPRFRRCSPTCANSERK